MTPEEIYEEWTTGESNGMRPARVQQLRQDIKEATGLYVPHRRSDLENWLSRMRQSGVLTKKLRAAAGAGTEASDDSDHENGSV